MNHRVPDFREMEEEDCVIPSSSGFPRPRKPSAEEEEIMELLWQNGQVVVQKSANNKAPFAGGGSSDAAVVREIRGSGAAAEEGHHLFMHEDEMASWLHYPIEDSSFARDLCADDLFYSAPMTTAEIRPPPAPPRPPISQPPPQRQGIPPRIQNFRHFSRLPRMEASSVAAARESTAAEPNVVHTASGTPAAVNTGLAALPCELTLTSSSPGASGGASFSASAERSPPRQKAEPSAAVGDRKRKAREADYNECQSEDMDFDAAEAKKQACGSTSTRRSRAALVHNQSERRRRDRINEKMKALQELIPRCNKSDKASMLDEAIEYMKSLQMQLQHMMSMGCGMVPMMYPAMQQHYMPAMMMGMGVNRPMMPYPSILPGSTIQNPAMGPRFPMALPGCHLPQVPLSDHSGNQASPLLNSHDSNQPRMQNLADPYQQFFSFHHAQLPSSQNQAGVQPPTTEPNTSKEVRDPKSKESGRR